jgi:hypothetical protein
VKGVSWSKKSQGWSARVTKDGVRYDALIRFTHLDDAVDALNAMKSYFLDSENYNESDYNFKPALIGKSAKSHNDTGEKYITFHKLTNKYRFRKFVDGKMKQIGVYDTLEEAVIAKNEFLNSTTGETK